MSLRDIKRNARRRLHRTMLVPALYIVPGVPEPLPCAVRPHSKWAALGSVKGTSFGYAEMEERGTEIVFWRAQVHLPQRGAVVSVEAGEAYRVDATDEPDDQTITARVTSLSEEEANTYPVPDDVEGDYYASLDPATIT